MCIFTYFWAVTTMSTLLWMNTFFFIVTYLAYVVAFVLEITQFSEMVCSFVSFSFFFSLKLQQYETITVNNPTDGNLVLVFYPRTFGMHTGTAKDQTTNLLISKWLALPPDLQQPQVQAVLSLLLLVIGCFTHIFTCSYLAFYFVCLA